MAFADSEASLRPGTSAGGAPMTPRPRTLTRKETEMAEYSRRDFIKGSLVAGAVAGAGLSFPNVLRAQDTVKIGVLHSLPGTIALGEVWLQDTVLVAVDEMNSN